MTISHPDLPPIAFTPFEALPEEVRVNVLGVHYARLQIPSQGELYVTRYGWPWLEHLLPEAWHTNRRYLTEGRRLAGATGHVYRMPTWGRAGRYRELVIKFCRFAQDLPVEVGTAAPTGPIGTIDEILARARFNSPFEEFGLLTELRAGEFGPAGLRILTKLPLAIFCPGEHYLPWELGRDPLLFQYHERLLEEEQMANPGVHMEFDRDYIMLFGYVRGRNAEEFCELGYLTEPEMQALTHLVADQLHAKGFWVLDHKPRHVILRLARDRRALLRRHGELVYALVDYELLQRTAEYQAWSTS